MEPDEGSADYGEATPESMHHDRFGIRQYPILHCRGGVPVQYVPQNTRGPVHRLGMTLHGAWKTFGGLRDYRITVDERDLAIRTYSDGRIKITLDDRDVYVEKRRVVTRKGVKSVVVDYVYDEAVVQVEADLDLQERLAAARQGINTNPTVTGT